MSEPLYKARCNKGHISIYEDKVVVGMNVLGTDNTETLARENIVGVDIKTTHSSLFGIGGAAKVTFNSNGGKSIETKMVKLKDAQKIREILQ